MKNNFDFKKPLHIFFNEDSEDDTKDKDGKKIASFSELLLKFESVQKLVLEYSLEKFLLLLNIFSNDLEIYVWIHPNIKRSMKDSEHSYPSLIVADSLKSQHPEIKFNLISRHPASAPKEITDHYKVYPITVLNKLSDNELLPQRIGTIKGEAKLFDGSKENTFDFAIITALFKDEFESVVEIFNLKKHDTLKLGDKNVYTGSLESDPTKKIVAIYQSEVGRTDASAIASEIIKEFNPRYIFMTGVCGGDEDVPFGSVVIARFVFTFDKGKFTEKGFFRELEFVKMNEDTIRQIREDDVKIMTEVKSKLISDKVKSKEYAEFSFQNLKSIIDPMACSSFVVDKANYFSEVIKSIERKATAVEMESYGIARGAETTNSGRTKSIIIKSVMDNTTEKNDKAKPFASYTSALYLKCLLENKTIS